jgi:hypothetical protein
MRLLVCCEMRADAPYILAGQNPTENHIIETVTKPKYAPNYQASIAIVIPLTVPGLFHFLSKSGYL